MAASSDVSATPCITGAEHERLSASREAWRLGSAAAEADARRALESPCALADENRVVTLLHVFAWLRAPSTWDSMSAKGVAAKQFVEDGLHTATSDTLKQWCQRSCEYSDALDEVDHAMCLRAGIAAPSTTITATAMTATTKSRTTSTRRTMITYY